MKRQQLVAIADAIAVARPDWNQPGIISALQVAQHTWEGTDAALIAHAVAVAARPDANTPAAIHAMPVQTRPTSAGQAKEPSCYICGRSRSGCQQLHDFEVAHGLPDPHIFETHEEADANTGKVQLDPIQLALAAMPRVNEYEESDDRKAAKARARAAVEAARQKSAWKPAPPPSDRRIQQDQPDQQEIPA